MSRLKRLMSIANLTRRHAGARGQVATVLLLMLVALLIFIFMTANLAQVSLTATRVANAADSSALLLGSQLATKARVLWESLGRKTQKCAKGGFLGSILAIVVAVVAIVVAPYVAPLLGVVATGAAGATVGAGAFVVTAGGLALTAGGAIAIGALGGAIGGAIGGGITGQGAFMGMLQGALIGASIGYGMSSTSFGGGKLMAAAEGEGVVTSGLRLIAPTEAIPVGQSALAGATTTALTSTSGATAGAAFSAGTNLATSVLQDQFRGDAIAAAAKALSGLPEYDRFRESAVFQALTQTVDDPNQIVDAEDSDGDGNTTEQVPTFQVWWFNRTKGILGTIPELTRLVQELISGPLTTMDTTAKAATGTSTSTICDDTDCSTVTTAGPLSRQEFEGADGAVVELARKLEESGHPVSFWKPGPSPAALQAWHDQECADCPPPPGYDEVDFTIDTLGDLIEVASGDPSDPDDGLIEQFPETLVGTWQTWIKLLYDPDPDNQEDFHDLFNVLINGKDDVKGMNAWKTEIETIRQVLPVCTYEITCDSDGMCVPTAVQNPPCKGDGTEIPISGGSVDTDLGDEFTSVQEELDTLMRDLTTFRNAPKRFSDDMQAASQIPMQSGGINPVTYAWTDSRGAHSVAVRVGPFRIAYIKNQKSGGFLKKKICLILKDYEDGGANTYIAITRQEPGKNLGLWNWNDGGQTITKTGRVSYGFNHVDLANN